ncbi:MAG TPA: glycosyltransferase [Hyphomicrobiaceae bacterium]|nr:glycosyltransferase [Hyphomicrobiaceae bacterium]
MSSVDIIIPNYNYGRFLPDCISSIESQGIDDYRILVVDNASTDDSVAIARTCAARNPRIEIVVNETNIGPQGNFNKGLTLASADYVMFLCADDWLAPGSMRRALHALDAHPEASFAIGREIHLLAEIVDIPPDVLHASAPWAELSCADFIRRICRFEGEQLALAGVVMRRAARERAGFYDERLHYYDDLEMALRLSTFGPVLLSASCHVIRRMHGANISATQWQSDLSGFDETLRALAIFFGNEDLDVPDRIALRREAEHNLAAQIYWRALSEAASGNIRRAKALYRFAVKIAPRYVFAPPLGYLRRRGGVRHVAAALRQRLLRSSAPEPAVRLGSSGGA